MKKCSASLALKEMQIKMTLIFCLIPGRMAVINNTKTTNAGKDVVKRKPYLLLVRMKINAITVEAV
jgi:hypothetical protein